MQFYRGRWVGLCCSLLQILMKAQANKVTPDILLPWALSNTPAMTKLRFRFRGTVDQDWLTLQEVSASQQSEDKSGVFLVRT